MSHSWHSDSSEKRFNVVLEKVASTDSSYQAIFTQLFDYIPSSGSGSLAGALITIKDLFDVEGYTTKGGTRFKQSAPPALSDAHVVSQLRKAGAVLIGHTNMTELAYSGLGLNPHYGTPENALYPGCIPGGSTSGGAVSVAKGLADVAIGTDTGGSLRIPAAFNGIVGFKPSQQCVSRRGCMTLSSTLDSVGPMASTVPNCRLAFEAIASTTHSVGNNTIANTSGFTGNPKFIIPTNFGCDDLQPEVEEAFTNAVSQLQAKGVTIAYESVPLLDQLAKLPVWQFSAVESSAEYALGDLIDPRVSSRMARAKTVDAVSYCKTLRERTKLVDSFSTAMRDTWLLLPTVPILPPALSVFSDDDTYNRINLQVLRNPSIANVLDGCSISIPYHYQSNVIGLMLIAPNSFDNALLHTASQFEKKLTAG